MANTIRHKRGTTRPTASDISTGELAINTAEGKIFTENDSGHIFEAGELLGAFSSSTITYTVTVASKTSAHRYNGTGSSNGYKINGVFSPFLNLAPGNTYKFDQADSSNSGHPLRFYLEADKSTAYTTNVTTNGTAGSSGAYTQIVITDTTPLVLHYQCSAHGYMGNSVLTNSKTVNYNDLQNQPSLFDGNYNSLSNRPTIPTATSQLTNDSGFITSSSSTDVVSDTTPQLGGDLASNGSDIKFADDDKALFGTGSDLEIFHDGSDSYINDAGTGSLILLSHAFKVKNAANNEAMIYANENGAVELYEDNTKRFETTSSGVSVTGVIASTGDISITNALPRINFYDSGENPDWEIGNINGAFRFRDLTNSATWMQINTDGHVDIYGNLDAQSGILNLGTADNSSGHINAYELMTFNIDTDNDDTNRYFAFYKNGSSGSGTELFKIEENGQATITGNLDVSSGLDVAGDTTFQNGTRNLNLILATNPTTGNAGCQFRAGAGDVIGFGADGTGIGLAINTSNQVGIGKIIATQALDVVGNIAVTGTVDGRDLATDGSKLDTYEANGSSYARSDADDTITGAYTFSFNSATKLVLNGNDDSRIYFKENGTDRGYLGWDAGNDAYWLWNNQQGTGFYLTNTPKWYDGSGYGTMWHSRNDGSGSGLDADTLDGVQGSNYMGKTGSYWNVNNWLQFSSTHGLYYPNNYGYHVYLNGQYLVIRNNTSSNGIRVESNSGTLRGMLYANNSNQIGFLDQTGNWSFKTDRSGGTAYLQDQHFYPNGNGAKDLGGSSNRWNNVYTSDLDLSNEAKGVNDIDGTWGHYTIVEGESDLFLKNNRSGKTYKFNLTEVS